MALATAYLNAVADNGNPITHIGLVDGTGTEITGGSPAYARKPVSWAAASGGTIRPSSDLVFDIPAGADVAGWRGFDALTGGTEYGGEDLTPESYAGQGTYTLAADQTAINHQTA